MSADTSNASPKSRLRSLAGRYVRWTYQSGHRDGLTAGLKPIVSAMSGVVLDVGGGRDSPLAGFWTDAARRIRLDISDAFGPHVQADGAALPIRSDAVDAVLMSEVLEHVPQPQAVIDEVFRVLKPGGTLAGSVPFLAQGLHADPHDYYRYTDQALLRFMAAFEDVSVRPHGNGLGIAWRMIVSRFRILRPLNPLMRRLSRTPDRRVPEGYTFRATKPDPSAAAAS